MTIKKEILDELTKDYRNPEDLLGENGLLKLKLSVRKFSRGFRG